MDHPPEYLSVKIPSRRLPLPLVTAVRRGVNWLLGFSEFNATYAPVIANGIPDNLAKVFSTTFVSASMSTTKRRPAFHAQARSSRS